MTIILDDSPIFDDARLNKIYSRFVRYQRAISPRDISNWLLQFRPDDIEVAQRIIEHIIFIDEDEIRSHFSTSLNNLEGWNHQEALREGKWRFVAYSGSAGESGDRMLHLFRRTNNLSGNQFNPLFIHRSQLLLEGLGSTDKVVFVDDFSGSGKQISDNWPVMTELLPGGPQTYIILSTACANAITQIQSNTEMIPIVGRTLNDNDNFFSDSNEIFSEDDKKRILFYCQKVWRDHPRGFGDCGLLLTFSHSCPNNSLPILHKNNAGWRALFQ
jgi:hypothetical protein